MRSPNERSGQRRLLEHTMRIITLGPSVSLPRGRLVLLIGGRRPDPGEVSCGPQ
jgi:hypothetical protein